MSDKVQEFLDEEIIKHAEKMGFAFLLKQEILLNKIIERFSLSRSKAVWEMTVFIQNNAGPTGDLAVIEKNGEKYFQWRYVEWPSWLPRYVKKPKWHRSQMRYQ